MNNFLPVLNWSVGLQVDLEEFFQGGGGEEGDTGPGPASSPTTTPTQQSDKQGKRAAPGNLELCSIL